MSIAVVRQREKVSRNYALIGTVVVHALIVLLLMWFVLMPPNPPLGGGQGMTMSFGEEFVGGPSDVPVIDPSVPEPQPQAVTNEEQVTTQEIEEAPEVAVPTNKPKVTTTKPTTTQIKPVEKPRVADQRAMFKKRNTTSTASGYGSGEAPGNQGTADGDPRGNPDGNGTGDGDGSGTGNGSGNGSGDGIGDGMGTYSLKGRNIVHRPVVTDNSNATGKVVVQIVVDRTGRVIKAMPGFEGSTTLDPALVEKSRKAAMDARFNPKPDGPEEQYGTITFIYRHKQ